MPVTLRTDVSASIHPDIIAAAHGAVLDHDSRPLGRQALAAGREALTAAYEFLGAFNDATRALDAASTRREMRGGRVLPVREKREDFLRDAKAGHDRADAALARRAQELLHVRDALAGQVAAAIELPERKTPAGIATGQEIRAHLKSLKPAERARTIKAAIDGKDRATIAAVIHGGPAYLAGMTSDEVETLRERVAAAWAPEESAQLKAVEAILGRVELAGRTLVKRYDEVLASLRESAEGRVRRSSKAMAGEGS